MNKHEFRRWHREFRLAVRVTERKQQLYTHDTEVGLLFVPQHPEHVYVGRVDTERKASHAAAIFLYYVADPVCKATPPHRRHTMIKLARALGRIPLPA